MSGDGRYLDAVAFFTCYFHEDWVLTAKSTDDVIEGYLAGEQDRDRIRRVASQIRLYLRSDSVDVEGDLWNVFGCNYYPAADGLDCASWLTTVAIRFEGAL